MMPRSFGPLAFGWVLTIISCSDSAPLFIALPELPAAVGFLLTFDQLDAAPVGMSEAIALDQGAVSPDGVSVRDDQFLVLIVPDDEQLNATGAKRRVAPAGAHQLALTTETCPFGRLAQSEEGTSLRIAVNRSARAYSARTNSPRFEPLEVSAIGGLSSASLLLPVEGGGCQLIENDAVQWFDPDRSRLLTEEVRIRGEAVVPRRTDERAVAIIESVALGNDRMIAAAWNELLLFVKGEPFTDAPTHRRSPSEVVGVPPPGPGETEPWLWWDLAAIPSTKTNQDRVVAGMVSEISVNGERIGFRSALVDVEILENGMASVRTATVWAGELRELMVEPSGEVLALWNESQPTRASNRDARLLRGASIAGPWETFLIASRIAGRSLGNTGDVRTPHMLGLSLGGVMLGNLLSTPPELRTVPTDLTGDIDGVAARPSEEGITLWSGSDRGLIVRISPGNFTVRQLDLRLPLDASACGGGLDACGWSAGLDRVTSLHHLKETDALLATFQGCEAAIVFRERDLCPSAVRLPGAGAIGNARSQLRVTPTPGGFLYYDANGQMATLSAR